MISKLIQAFNGHGKDKVFAGDRKVDLPESMEEAEGLWGDAKFVKMAVESYVIAIQGELRNGGKVSAKSQLNDLISSAKQQRMDGDSALFDRLVSAEIIKE